MRCTADIIDIRDGEGRTPLMVAVEHGRLDSVKEMDRLEGTEFRTENSQGDTLLQVARRRYTTGEMVTLSVVSACPRWPAAPTAGRSTQGGPLLWSRCSGRCLDSSRFCLFIFLYHGIYYYQK
jgi:hypothetical protein